MKLPILPRPGNILEAKYTKEQMREYAMKAIADEREKVAAWMIQRSYATGHGDTVKDLLKELDWQIRESEREACAKVCDELGEKGYVAEGCAAAIRARGQQ